MTMRDLLVAMAEQNASMPAFRAALAHFCAEAGRVDEARSELEAVARAGLATLPRDANWLSMMGELVQVVAVLGDAARAAELYDLLARNRRRIKLVDSSARDYPELAAYWFEGARGGVVAQLCDWLESRIRRGALAAVPDVGAAARLISSCNPTVIE